MNSVVSDRQSRILSLGYDYESQPKEDIAECNLCKSSVFTVITHRDRYGYAAEASFCNECGLIMLNPRMMPQAYAQFYSDIYRPLVSAYHGRLINAHSIQEEQRVYAQQHTNFLRPFLSLRHRGSLLDIGGSTGVVAEHLVRTFGLVATILDPAPAELANAEQLGMKVVAGFLEDFDSEHDECFDLITLCQTIDHLLDVSTSLAKIKRLLDPQGLFFVDIVDFRAAYLRNRSVEEAIKIDHPYYLTESTMEAYLRRAGFRILRKNYAPDHLHVGYACTHGEIKSDFLPSETEVRKSASEIRQIQNRGPV